MLLALSRPLILTLDGSNTGNNTIASFSDNGGANGAIHLVKQGAGTWILSGATGCIFPGTHSS